jgi:alpha-galactosidase
MKKPIILFFILSLSLLNFVIGQKTEKNLQFLSWAPTPPYGWNSWDCYGPTVTEAEVKANADYMAKNLKSFGWEYIVVDIRWYVDNDKSHGYNEINPAYVMDEYGRFLPSPIRFPSSANGKGFRPLADYVHSLGLKFGIHIMRGIPKIAVKKNTPILGSKAKAADIYGEEQLCKWLGDMYTVVTGREGAQEYYNSLFNLYASWGLDFIKVDDLSVPYHKSEIEMIRKAIDQTGRKIVLSTSPGETPIENAEHVENHANMWRTIDDFWDNWPELKQHFEICNRWAPYIGNGHFPDADMLPMGKIGIRAERGDNRMSKFTNDELYTMMTLFAIFRSPLMFGGDLPQNDQFTLSLLTNEEVLNVNKYSSNNHQLFRNNDLIAWVADDQKSEDKYVALFDAQDQPEILENKAALKSELLSAKSGKVDSEITLDITGAHKLYLVVSDGGDNNGWDHADWIEPVISGQKGTIKLTSLEWVKATSGWNQATKNRSVGGAPLIVNGKQYTDGIGTHSNSVIEFNIPEGYSTFSAKVGLDKECIDHPEGASVRFLVFTQDPSGEKVAPSAKVPVTLAQLGLNGSYKVRDLWSHKDMGTITNEFTPSINNHGAGLYRFSKVK